MFTGIIEATGAIAEFRRQGNDARLHVRSSGLDWSDVKLGDSIAVSGVCLTAVRLHGDSFEADVSGETLARTTLGDLRPSSEVNLEKALTPTTRLGGHLVSGHVDGVGELVARSPAGQSVRLDIRAPATLAKYIAEKGSICVDGISLTVNQVQGAVFSLNIVPHTLQVTTLKHLRPGSAVNLEVDLLARYLERLLLGDTHEQSRITPQLLAQHGFL